MRAREYPEKEVDNPNRPLCWQRRRPNLKAIWHDSSYAVVAILAGWVADLFEFAPAIVVVGLLPALSGFVV
jgi:hypothetical protein